MPHGHALHAPANTGVLAEIVAEVAAASKGRSENAEAYQFYLQARFHREQLTKDGTAKAIQFYLQSIHVDPSYALAWSGLSRAYADAYARDTVKLSFTVKAHKAPGSVDVSAVVHDATGAVITHCKSPHVTFTAHK